MEQFFDTFLNWDRFTESFPQVVKGLTTNLSLMVVAELCVLAWGLMLALLRSSRSRAIAPARWLAIGYIDLFRALPGLIVIYMVGFGIPIAQVPWIGDWSLFQLAVLATFAREVSSRVCFLDGGVICEQGEPEQMLTEPTNPRTQVFLKRIIAAGRL